MLRKMFNITLQRIATTDYIENSTYPENTNKNNANETRPPLYEGFSTPRMEKTKKDMSK